MPKYIICFIIYFAALGLTKDSFADSIGISPKRIVIESDERVADVVLINSGSKSEAFEILTINKRMNKNGQLEDATEPASGEFFANTVLRYTPRHVQIAPGQAQKVRILSRFNDTSKDGEYRSHMLFKQLPDETTDPSSP